jgi:hypothetical protein
VSCAWYCSDDCADAARRDSLLAAGRIYQRTEAGRANHAARQQDYLDKREAAKMTHQSAENLPLASIMCRPSYGNEVSRPSVEGQASATVTALDTE